jgi:hypothetical protein
VGAAVVGAAVEGAGEGEGEGLGTGADVQFNLHVLSRKLIKLAE